MSTQSKEYPEFPYTEDQLRWLDALESGEYAQAMGQLFDGSGYCCLGVACEALGLERTQETIIFPDKPSREVIYRFGGERTVAPREVVERLKLLGNCGDARGFSIPGLAGMNDSGKFDFKAIADVIRLHPTDYLTNLDYVA